MPVDMMQTPDSYTMMLCGDCSRGPPCRCSSDPAVVSRIWRAGKWVWVAACTPKKAADDE